MNLEEGDSSRAAREICNLDEGRIFLGEFLTATAWLAYEQRTIALVTLGVNPALEMGRITRPARSTEGPRGLHTPRLFAGSL